MSDPTTLDGMAVDLAGVALRNPVVLASGTAGYLDELSEVLDLSRVGGVVTKSITARPRPGNKTWRIVECRGGMLNAIGLANVGSEEFERAIGPRVQSVPTTVIGSIAGFSVEDYTTVGAMWAGIDGVDLVELNLSCPNVHGGLEFGANPEAARALVSAVRPMLAEKKISVKLSPRTNDIVAVARACVEAGADVLTIGNTFPAMAIDVETRRPRLSRITGGLSGPAIHPITLKLVFEVHRAVARDSGTPIIGAGGVTTWKDAAAYILAGASAVQMGAALFADPRSPLKVAAGLEKWVRRQGCDSVRELVGMVEAP